MVSAVLLTYGKNLARRARIHLLIELVVSPLGMPSNIFVPPRNNERPRHHHVGNCRLVLRLSKTHNTDTSHPRTDKGIHRARLGFRNTVGDEGSQLVEGTGCEGQVLMKLALLG